MTRAVVEWEAATDPDGFPVWHYYANDSMLTVYEHPAAEGRWCFSGFIQEGDMASHVSSTLFPSPQAAREGAEAHLAARRKQQCTRKVSLPTGSPLALVE